MTTKVFSEQSILQMPQRMRANFINSLSGFKSANLIGTSSAKGELNLSIISSVFHVGAHPPLLGMIMRPHTVVRDTLENIKQTGMFTINHVHDGITKQAHQCSARYEPSENEFEEVGLTPQMSNMLPVPFVAESRIKLALEVEQVTVIELNKTELVIGRIVEAIVGNEFLLEDGYVDIEEAGSVAISCLDSYHNTERIDRFSYAKPNEKLVSIWEQDK
ncbi:flavin reductase family protein [Glaciecola petra]|uniref:Flavin reductase family protein n=1 Tax=Glaciecola petra TaxID=3075602 RepID=A0ABU2ZR36_9ALTE|nr:flavin reductase family protein [Aestuariibacter sp. P117]MDT0595077.1 flavin reductase family protein [Aestuariibacter sp. P117]